ncbi:hypothetical protein PYCC9005_002083 [Savitreella phatthalungensis]
MASKVFAPGRVALITGGASGVGLACAKLCHQAGMSVVLADRDSDLLQSAVKSFSTRDDSARVVTLSADLAQHNHWNVVRQTIVEEFVSRGTPLTVFFNNAGISGSSDAAQRFSLGDLSKEAASAFDIKGPAAEEDESCTMQNWQQVLDVNFWAQKRGLEIIVPLMLASMTAAGADVRGAIICTGSKQGITCPPGNAAYNVSKAAVKMTTEHAAWELRQVAAEKSHRWSSAAANLSVHLLVPGWTWTGLTKVMAPAGSEKPDGCWSAEQVADYMAPRVEKAEFYIICPDGSVTEQLDNARMAYTVGDITSRRPALSRWHEDYKQTFDDFVAKELDK